MVFIIDISFSRMNVFSSTQPHAPFFLNPFSFVTAAAFGLVSINFEY